MKKLLTIMLLTLSVVFLFADVVIGNGITSQDYPMSTLYNYYRSATLYTAAEINASGTITHLKWYCTEANGSTSFPITIYMKQTTATVLANNTWANHSAGATQVFSGTLAINTPGWFTFDITDFVYNGTSNLEILVQSGSAAYITPYVYWRCTTTSTNMFARVHGDGSLPTNLTTSTSRPNIILAGITPAGVPSSTTPVTPANEVTDVLETDTLNWNMVSAATGYKLYFGTDNPPTNLVNGTNLGNVESFAPSEDMAFSTQYYWQIVPTNSVGNASNCPVWSFVTRADPAQHLPYTQDFNTTSQSLSSVGWTGNMYLGANHGNGGSRGAYYDLYDERYSCYAISCIIGPMVANAELVFDYRMVDYSGYPNNATILGAGDNLQVQISTDDGASYSTIYTIDHLNHISSNAFVTKTVELDAFSSGNIRVKFLGTWGSGDYYLDIDNVIVRETYVPPEVSFSPSSLDFGLLRYGVESPAQSICITNSGGSTLNLVATDFSISGPDAGMFSFGTGNLPAALTHGQSVLIPVTATLTQEGVVSATLSFTNNQVRATYSVSLCATGLAEGVVEIGSGSSNSKLPVYPYYIYTYSQSIYLQSEINAPNLRIENISYYWNGAGTATHSNDWTIYLGHTSFSYFDNGSSWIPLSNLTQVFSGTVELPATPGWINIRLTTPFVYNNTDNLVVAVDENADNYDEYNRYFYSTAAPTWRSLITYSDNSNPDPAAPYVGNRIGAYPNIRLRFDDLAEDPPGPVELSYPIDGATEIPWEGFDLSWMVSYAGGTPSSFVVYMSQNPDSLLCDYQWITTATSINPLSFSEGPSPAIESFGYNEHWYWTVKAINSAGSATCDPPHSFFIQSDPRLNLPYSQDFGNSLSWPEQWTQANTGGVSDPWVISDSNRAGNSSNEMRFSWASGTMISRLISPPFFTEGISQISVNFNQIFDCYYPNITAKLQYSYDLVTWWDTSWSIQSVQGYVGPNNNTARINGIASDVLYLAWTLDGNHTWLTVWNVDDVLVQVSGIHDVATVSYDNDIEVVAANTLVTPMATVTNYGTQSESFGVICSIGSYSDTQSVSGLAIGASRQISFASFTPALGSTNSVVISTLLDNDSLAANNTVQAELICLDLNINALANNADTGAFVSFLLADPDSPTTLPNAYTGSSYIVSADWVNGTWRGLEYDSGFLENDNYYQIDPLTGVYQPPLGEVRAALRGMAYDATHNLMYGVLEQGKFYTLNPGTGLASLQGDLWVNQNGFHNTLYNTGGMMYALAYDNVNNVLYGFDMAKDCLWTINPATLEVTLKGFLGIDVQVSMDAAFDQNSGQLFLAAYTTSGGLYLINTTTGGAYKIGSFPNGAQYTAFVIPYGGFAEAPVATISGSGVITWNGIYGASSYHVYSSDYPSGPFTLEADVTDTSYSNATANKKFYRITAVNEHRESKDKLPINAEASHQPLSRKSQSGM